MSLPKVITAPRAGSLDEDLGRELLDRLEPLPLSLRDEPRTKRSRSDLAENEEQRIRNRLRTIPLSEFKRVKAQVDLVHKHRTTYTLRDWLCFLAFMCSLYLLLVGLMWVFLLGIEWDSRKMGWGWMIATAGLMGGLAIAMYHAEHFHSRGFPSLILSS